MDKTLVLKPHLSEKSYALSDERNTYVFNIPSGANRQAVAKAVAIQYKVTVEGVRIASSTSKTKRNYRRRGRFFQTGQRSTSRKAYVQLKEGDKLPIFSAVEDDKKAEKEKK